jgi:hypothetical protein
MGSSGIMVLKSIIDRCYIVHHHHEFVPSTSSLSVLLLLLLSSPESLSVSGSRTQVFDKRSTKRRRRCEQILSCKTQNGAKHKTVASIEWTDIDNCLLEFFGWNLL